MCGAWVTIQAIMVFAWSHILFARINGVHTWCEGMHAMCLGTITNMHMSMESMHCAWTLLQVDKEYMHVSKNLGHGSMEHMYDLGLKQCLCNCHNFYVFTSIGLCLCVCMTCIQLSMLHRWTSMVQWHICMLSICIFMVQWHKGRVSIDVMVHCMAQGSK